MEFHNTFAITMKNESAATTAYGIIKNRLELGFKTDNEYRENPSTLMASSLQVSGNTIYVPEEMSFYTVTDFEEVFIVLLKHLAKVQYIKSAASQENGLLHLLCSGNGLLNLVDEYTPKTNLDLRIWSQEKMSTKTTVLLSRV